MTVLLTGPASLIMMNCERLMKHAQSPLFELESAKSASMANSVPYQEDKYPYWSRCVLPDCYIIGERDDVQHYKNADWSLVEQELHAAAFEQLVISCDEYSVDGAC